MAKCYGPTKSKTVYMHFLQFDSKDRSSKINNELKLGYRKRNPLKIYTL